MKKIYAFLVVSFCLFLSAHATRYYWVGPVNGKWSDPANWSLGQGIYPYPGGAGVPGPGDGAYFPSVPGLSFVVNVDVSPTVANFGLSSGDKVTLFTSVNTTLTVTSGFNVQGTLTDSTTEDVKFNFVLDHAGSTFTALNVPSYPSYWIFSGRVPVSSGNGAMLTIKAGPVLTVTQSCYLISRNNSGDIVSDSSTLQFAAGSYFTLENNLNGYIPAATWAVGIENPSGGFISPPEIQITGDARIVRHSGNNNYGSFVIDLPNLSADANLSLPDGAILKQNLTVSSTNNHTLTLLSAISPTSSVSVNVPGNQYIRGTLEQAGGIFTLRGNSKVALAQASASAPGTSYRLNIRNFVQSGGNFSLQDADNSAGSSVLSVLSGFQETAGTFITNSTATNPTVKFVVEMKGPYFINSPAGTSFSTPGAPFNVSSGTIDNAAHMVTLRMAQTPFIYTSTSLYVQVWSPTGIVLGNPLQVGKLELNGGPVITSAANVLTIANPSPSAVQVTNANSYVQGPVIRATNSTVAYTFPTGKSNYVPARPNALPPNPFFLDSCVIIPSTATPSMYQAEYFLSRYSDTAAVAPFRGVDTSEYWNISKLLGADAQVQLFLTNAVPEAKSTDNLVVAHYVGGKWVSEQGTILSPGNVTTGSVTSKVLSAFSPFTFGYGAFINAPLTVHLISFDGHQENGGNVLSWKTASLASRFEVLRAIDGINFSSIGTIPALSMQQQYTFFDNKPQPGKNFYRLRSVENEGAVSLSNVIMINGAGDITELFTLAPTVVTGNASLRINTIKEGQLELMVTDMNGRSWKKLTLAIRAGSSSNTINLSDLPAGTYQISGYMNGKQSPAVRFIKQ